MLRPSFSALAVLLLFGFSTARAQNSDTPALPAVPAGDSTPVATAGIDPDRPARPAADAAPAADHNLATGTGYSEVRVDGPYIAITFDDGPSPKTTPGLLDLLAKKNIRATFFVIGQNAQEYPEILKRIAAEGHEVANHSWSHPNLAKMSDSAVRSQLQRTQDTIAGTLGRAPVLFRPPYGSITKTQRNWIHDDMGLKIILWSVDPFDWKKPGAGVIASRILAGTHPGSIILAHDIHAQTVAAMPQTLDGLLAKGFKFVTVSDLLAMHRPGAPKPAATAPETPASSEVPAARAIPVDAAAGAGR